MKSCFWLHEYRIFWYKRVCYFKHFLLERPIFDFFETRHALGEWITDKIIKRYILILFFRVSNFEILFLIHLFVKKHQRLRSVMVLHIFCRLVDVLVGIWRTAIKFIQIVIMVSCHEECKRYTLESIFEVIYVVTVLPAYGSGVIPVWYKFDDFFHPLLFDIVKSQRA